MMVQMIVYDCLQWLIMMMWGYTSHRKSPNHGKPQSFETAKLTRGTAIDPSILGSKRI